MYFTIIPGRPCLLKQPVAINETLGRLYMCKCHIILRYENQIFFNRRRIVELVVLMVFIHVTWTQHRLVYLIEWTINTSVHLTSGSVALSSDVLVILLPVSLSGKVLLLIRYIPFSFVSLFIELKIVIILNVKVFRW